MTKLRVNQSLKKGKKSSTKTVSIEQNVKKNSNTHIQMHAKSIYQRAISFVVFSLAAHNLIIHIIKQI